MGLRPTYMDENRFESGQFTIWWALDGKGRGNSGSVEAVVGVWPGLRVWTNLCRAIARS
jgi:hypothetical protein